MKSTWSALGVTLILTGLAYADPPVPRDAAGRPVSLEVTEFATGLSFPYGMALADDGSLLVGVSYPDGNFLKSEGAVVRLVDADDDGVADGPGTPLVEGLVGVVTALSRAGPFLLVTSAQARSERIQVLRVGASPADPLTLEGSVVFDFATGRLHASYALAVRPVAGEASAWEVFFNVGSTANVVSEQVEAPVGGLLTGTVLPDSVYRFVLRDGSEGAEASGLRQVARGLRNAAALVLAPDGSLLAAENGIDLPSDRNEQFSADELDRIVLDEVGQAPIPDFGFPDSYVAYRTGAVVGGGVQPLHVFQPIGAAEAEGPASMALAPPLFPPGLRDGVFIGFHGKFDDHGPVNEENPVVYASLDGQTSFHFLGVDEPAIAHIDGLLSTADSLYLSDLSGTGSLFFDVAATGVVYRMRAVQVTGDANGDGRVDEADLDIFAQHRLRQVNATASRGDFDGDGDVDDRDLLVWATRFGVGTETGRREPAPALFADRFLTLPGLDHVGEITAPLVEAARSRLAELEALPSPTRDDVRDSGRLALFVKRQTRPRSRLRADFAKLREASRRLRNLSTALPEAAFDDAFALARLAIAEQVEIAEEAVRTGAQPDAFRSVERRLGSVAELRAKAASATDERSRAGLLRKAFARAETAVKRAAKLLRKRGIDAPPQRVRNGDVVGVAGARVAVSREAASPLAGVSLLVPPDALAGLQVIEFSAADDVSPVPDGATPIGPAVRIAFSDEVFLVPAQVCLPLELPQDVDAADVVLLVDDDAGVRSVTAVVVTADGCLRAAVGGRGTVQVAVAPAR